MAGGSAPQPRDLAPQPVRSEIDEKIVGCVVHKGASGLTGTIEVIVPAFSDLHVYQVSYWSPRPAGTQTDDDLGGIDWISPSAGDTGQLAFNEQGEPALVVWIPS